MIATVAMMVAAAPVMTAGAVPIAQTDIVDARALPDAGGQPMVMLTLTPAAMARVKVTGTSFAIDGKPVVVQIGEASIEFAVAGSYEAAAALALALSGKPPLPDSLDE